MSDKFFKSSYVRNKQFIHKNEASMGSDALLLVWIFPTIWILEMED